MNALLKKKQIKIKIMASYQYTEYKNRAKDETPIILKHLIDRITTLEKRVVVLENENKSLTL